MELLETGAVVPAILGAAYVLWHLGVRDPFLLTVGALLIGGAAGWAINAGLARLLDGRRKTNSTRRRM